MNDPAPPPVPAPPYFNWLLFLAVMLSPVVLTMLTVRLGDKSGDAAPAVAFFGGGAAGIVCGILLGRRLGKTMPLKVLLSLVFTFVMAVVCIGMSCGGCLVSEYQLNFH